MNLKFQAGKEHYGSFKVWNKANNTKQPPEQVKTAEDIFKELNDLIGLNEIKKLIIEIHAYVEIQKKRQKENLQADPLVLHMIFKGHPGTGKTTVARIIGKLFKAMGVLSKGHLIEVERADLVGEYIGHTAQKTREMIKQSQGGVLFIDEAYSLARGGERDFGKESIDVLVKAMEDYKDDLILVLAGYPDEMEWFLKSNPGLRSRFPNHIEFPDYTITELYLIGEQMLKKRQYALNPEGQRKLCQILENSRINLREEGNARYVRNIIEQAIRRQAVRLIGKTRITREELMIIKSEDLE